MKLLLLLVELPCGLHFTLRCISFSSGIATGFFGAFSVCVNETKMSKGVLRNAGNVCGVSFNNEINTEENHDSNVFVIQSSALQL